MVHFVASNVDRVFELPECMGEPASNQLQGGFFEKLAETAGRVCYDSFGKGRSSKEYHAHIKEVGHLSVYEHCQFTVQIKHPDFDAWCIVNRPGVSINGPESVTLNLRALLEWDQWTQYKPSLSKIIGDNIKKLMHEECPMIVDAVTPEIDIAIRRVRPAWDTERFYTYHLIGSRGFSHELVRHGDQTAISQRSTRYVDESESPMCWHPAITNSDVPQADMLDTADGCRAVYDRLVGDLMERGVSRKQARGAARGVLPNALETQIIFSATEAQWNRIFAQRISDAADEEIRIIMERVRDDIASRRLS